MTPARVTPMPLAYDSVSALRLAGRVLVNGEQRRRAGAFDVQLADAVARATSARPSRRRRPAADRDGAEADVEAVREHQHLARREVRLDGVLVELRRPSCRAPAP